MGFSKSKTGLGNLTNLAKTVRQESDKDLGGNVVEEFKSKAFEEWLELARNYDHSSEKCKMIYISSEIADIFSLIKQKTGIQIKTFVALILEEWIKAHAPQIRGLDKKYELLERSK